MHLDGIFEKFIYENAQNRKLQKHGIMNVCLKGRKFCFISTVKEWMINIESDSQEILNPAISSNTNPTCNVATISLKMVVGGRSNNILCTNKRQKSNFFIQLKISNKAHYF
jgi:hypothetical protein